MPTAGQILVNETLPPAYRDYERVLDKKALKKVLTDIAKNEPEKYQEVLGNLGRLGAQCAQRSGGYSLATDVVQTPEFTKKYRARVQRQLKAVYENDRLSREEKDEKVVDILSKAGDQFRPLLNQYLMDNESPVGLMVASGAKGNQFAMSAGVGFDGMYADSYDNPIAYPVMHNYSEGLSPFEYWAGSHGARGGVITPKLGTAKSGWLSKQLTQTTHRGVISGQDAPEGKFREGVGLPATADDNDNIGRYLAHPVGGYPRNTLITSAVLKDLQRKKVDDILVRSPIVGGPGDGSLYSYDVGEGEFGRNYVAGENPSITAAQGISEHITQSMLSAKHCLAAGTLVRMADFTVRKIEDVRVDDMVLGVNDDLVAYPVRVTKVFNNGPKECWKTSFSVAQEHETTVFLESTLEHRILGEARYAVVKGKLADDGTVYEKSTEIARDGEFDIGHQRSHDNLRCIKLAGYPVSSVWDFDGVDEPMAFLLGLLVGDGCYTSDSGLLLSCHDDTLVQDLAPYVRNLGVYLHQTGSYGNYSIKKIESTKNPHVVNPVRAKLRELGMDGKYSYEKILPQQVYGWNKKSIAALLGGLFVADGGVCVYKGKNTVTLHFSSASEALVRQVRELLVTRFGMLPSKIGVNNSDSSWARYAKTRKRPNYQLRISRRHDVEIFYREIPFMGVKRGVFGSLMQGTAGAYHKPVRKFYRKAQESLGDLPTYDLEVDSPNHLYVLANGLIVHNSGGVYGGTAKGVSGFKSINNMLQSPSTWEGAIHAQDDGKVQSVQADELGNQVILINGKKHVIPHSHKVKVKAGDAIEAGDVLTNGMPNPAELIKHKGIGEGRRAYVSALRDTLADSGVRTSNRNLELVTRNLVNHIHIQDEHGDYLPGDTVSYSQYEENYEPRENSNKGRPDYFAGQYLEQPVLHYTIGTKLRPSVLANLKKYGIKEVVAHKEPPRFQSNFVRAMANASVSDDWLNRMGGSYQKRSIQEAAQKGMTADPFGPSFYAAVVGRTDFTKRQPGQRDPIIKSVLPYLPKEQAQYQQPAQEPEDPLWFEYDSDEPPVQQGQSASFPVGGFDEYA